MSVNPKPSDSKGYHHAQLGATGCTEANAALVSLWLYEASNPYWEWLWGSASTAMARFQDWQRRPNSELSSTQIVCLKEADRDLGCYLALTGPDLHDRRKADLHALLNCLRRDPSASMIMRLRQARELFPNVAENEFYLSRIGVAPLARGRGVGRNLLELFLEDGRKRGFKHFRLDVSAENNHAIQLYRGAGFAVSSESSIPETPISYCSMTAIL